MQKRVNDVRAFTFFILTLGCSPAFANLDYKQLAATKRDQPTVVITTENITLAISYGAFDMPRGSTVKVMAIKPDGSLDVEYQGEKCSIPAGKTDLEKRVADIRSRRIVIDGIEYEDVKFSDPTPSDVTIAHRSGTTKLPLEKLPPELQKRFGYDPEKAAQYRLTEKNRRDQAVRDDARRKLLEEIRASAIVVAGTVSQITNDGVFLRDAIARKTEQYTEEVQDDTSMLAAPPAHPEFYRHKETRTRTVPVRIANEDEPVFILRKLHGDDKLTDGDRISVTIYPAGTYRYTTVTGTVKTIKCFTLTPEDAFEYVSKKKAGLIPTD